MLNPYLTRGLQITGPRVRRILIFAGFLSFFAHFYNNSHFLSGRDRGLFLSMTHLIWLNFTLCADHWMDSWLGSDECVVVVMRIGTVVAAAQFHGDVFVGISNSFRAEDGLCC